MWWQAWRAQLGVCRDYSIWLEGELGALEGSLVDEVAARCQLAAIARHTGARAAWDAQCLSIASRMPVLINKDGIPVCIPFPFIAAGKLLGALHVPPPDQPATYVATAAT